MHTIGMNDLRTLIAPQRGPCVSIFLPTHVFGEAGQQDAPRLKNLLDQAEERLVETGMPTAKARKMLQPARELPDDPAYWNGRSHGLAVFVAPEEFMHFRLPLAFDESVFVGQRFLIRPLLPLLSGPTRFFILVLSQNKVQFFEADRQRIELVEIPNLQAKKEEALNYTSVDRGTQAHSAMHGRLGKQAAVFHGQGGEPDTRKDEIEHYFRMVDAALHPLLREQQAPLLLVGVDYLLPIYRRVNRYPQIVDAEVHGNCDYLTPHKIHERAWPTVESVVDRAHLVAAARYERTAGTEKAASDLRKILPAARAGRIEILLIDQAAQRWGITSSESDKVQVHQARQPGDDDLLDLAAVETLHHGGKVYAVKPEEMPVRESAAALLRY